MKYIIKNYTNKSDKFEPQRNKKGNAMPFTLEKDIQYEDESKRSENTRHFIRSDGTARAIISPEAVNYYDDSTNTYKDIDNSLKDNGNEIVNKANSFKVKFDKSTPGGKVFELEKGRSKITLACNSLENMSHGCKNNCKCFCCDDTNGVIFKDINENTDIEYLVESDRIKENIIIKTPTESYVYDFKLNIENLKIEAAEDGKSINLKNIESGEIEFYIPAPFMYDKSGVRSDDVYYEVENKSDSILKLSVIASKEFINAAERVFPVTIDPQIVKYANNFTFTRYAYDERNLVKTFFDSDDSKKNIIYAESFKDYRNSVCTHLYLNPVSLPNCKILKATLILTPISFNGPAFINGISFPASREPIEVDITKQIKYSSIEIKIMPGMLGVESFLSYYNNVSYLIDYILPEVIPTTQTFSIADKAVGTLDLSKGTFATQFVDVEPNYFALPLSISHNHKYYFEELNCGNYWRLNLHQKLTKKESVGVVSNYLYTDEFGIKHDFAETFYIITDDNTKQYIYKDDIVVGFNGKLTYNGQEVYSYQFCTKGLSIIPEITEFINAENIEQKQEEHKQLEQTVKSYENNLKNMVVVNSSGNILKRLKILDSNNFNSFINVNSGNMILSESEAQSFKSMKLQYDSMGLQNSSMNLQATSMDNQFNGITYQKTGLDDTNRMLNDSLSDGSVKDYQKNYNYWTRNLNNSIYTNLSSQQTNINSQKTNLISQRENYLLQRNLLLTQINSFIGDITTYKDGVKNKEEIEILFKEYLNKKYELEVLERQTPVNFLRDENNIIRGFNRVGNLVTFYDAYENAVIIEYDEIGKIVSVYDSENHQVALDYNKKGQLLSMSDDIGRKVSYEYDDRSDLTKVTFANESSLNFDYVSSVITRAESSENSRTAIVYDTTSPTSIVNSSLVSKVTKNGNTLGINEISRFKIDYDENSTTGNIIATTITDTDSVKQKYSFNEFGELTTYEKTKDDKVERSTYDYLRDNYYNTTTTKTGAIDTVTENTSLNLFNKPFRTESGWETINIDEATNESTKVKTISDYTYDNNHKLILIRTEQRTKVGELETSKFTCVKQFYNLKGALVRTESLQEGEQLTSGINIEEKVYDKKGRQIKNISWNTLDSSSKFYEELEYAENGQVAAEIDESGENKTIYNYKDGTNIVRSLTDPCGGKLAYGRDITQNNITSITSSTEDGEANETSTLYKSGLAVELKSGSTLVNYEYDHKKRKTAVQLNGEDYARYIYTENTDSDTVTATLYNSNNTTVTIATYDKQGGNLLSTSVNGNAQIANTFNADNALISSVDLSKSIAVTTTNSYDTVKRLKKSERKDSSNTLLSENYAYTSLGELQSLSISGGVEQTYLYAYNDNYARDLAFTVLPSGVKSAIKNDVYGRQKENIYSINDNNIMGQYTYYKKVGDRATNQVSSVKYGEQKNGKYVIGEGLKYRYDGNGNITEVHENDSLAIKYSYDRINRLIREDNKKLGKTYLYSYDVSGNILSKKQCNYSLLAAEELIVASEKNYLYDSENANRLVGYEIPNTPKAAKYCGTSFAGSIACGNVNGLVTSYNYDSLGNPTQYNGKALLWKKGRQLAKYDTLNFTYDGYGRRINKGGTSYFYSTDGKLLKQVNGLNTLEFIYNNGIAGVKHNNTQYLYRKNIQGDVTALLDKKGNVVVKYVYDAWGNHKVYDSSNTDITNNDEPHIGNLNPFRYRSYYYDTETNLYFLQSRYYDPSFGRFINADSIEYLDPETIGGLNLYSYCGNNPVMRIDPSGNAWFDTWWGKALIGIGIVVGTALFVAAIIASAGTVGALAGVGAAALGFSAGTVSAIATGFTIGTYVVAAGVGIFGLNDAVTAWSGINLMQTYVFGGNETAYNVTKGVFTALGTVAVLAGSFGPKILQKIAGKWGTPVYKNDVLVGHKYDLGKKGWSARIDATTHGRPGHNNPHLHLLQRDTKHGGISKNIYYFWEIIKGWLKR